MIDERTSITMLHLFQFRHVYNVSLIHCLLFQETSTHRSVTNGTLGTLQRTWERNCQKYVSFRTNALFYVALRKHVRKYDVNNLNLQIIEMRLKETFKKNHCSYPQPYE